jgi:hypothetical protein
MARVSLSSVPREEIEACTRALQEVHDQSGAEVERVLDQIRPTVLELGPGPMLMIQLEKLARAGNAQRAIKLLESVPRTRRSFQRACMIGGIALLPIVVSVFMFALPRIGGGYDEALAALARCPTATELLGGGIAQSPLGFACGSSQSGSGGGRANWSIPVRGDRASGDYQYRAGKTETGWQVSGAWLEVQGRRIQVVPCAVPPGERVHAAVELPLKVTKVEGIDAARTGDDCRLSMRPARDTELKKGFNCQVRVACGTKVLYGWDGTGLARCTLEHDEIVRASDPNGQAQNDDPLLEVDLSAGTAMVGDNGDKPYSIGFAILPAPR